MMVSNVGINSVSVRLLSSIVWVEKYFANTIIKTILINSDGCSVNVPSLSHRCAPIEIFPMTATAINATKQIKYKLNAYFFQTENLILAMTISTITPSKTRHSCFTHQGEKFPAHTEYSVIMEKNVIAPNIMSGNNGSGLSFNIDYKGNYSSSSFDECFPVNTCSLCSFI